MAFSKSMRVPNCLVNWSDVPPKNLLLTHVSVHKRARPSDADLGAGRISASPRERVVFTRRNLRFWGVSHVSQTLQRNRPPHSYFANSTRSPGFSSIAAPGPCAARGRHRSSQKR
jgi:hypothetical protein